jgi:tetratricopeptide (TPR) repeat protein
VRELLDRAIEADPTSREALELMCSLEVANGLRWLRPPEQAFEDARSAARKLLEFDRVNAIALATMGFVRGVLDRDLESALVLSDAAFARAPASVGPLCFTRAWSLAANGKLKLAIDVLESGIETNGHDRGLYATLGLFLYFAHRYREAREALEDHVMNVSPFSSCWAVLALVHSAEGNFERALSCAEKAAASDDSCPTIASSLASVLAAMGHSAEAEAKLTDLLHEPVQAAPSLLAPIFALLGQRDRMMSALTQAVRQKCPYHPLIGMDPRLM